MTDIINQDEETEKFLNQASVAGHAIIDGTQHRISIGTDEMGREFVQFTDSTNDIEPGSIRIIMESVFEANPGNWECKDELGQLIDVEFVGCGPVESGPIADEQEECVNKITELLLKEYRATGLPGVKAALRLSVMHFAFEHRNEEDSDDFPEEEELEAIAAELADAIKIPLYAHGYETTETDQIEDQKSS
jgi:hypothetical protein